MKNILRNFLFLGLIATCVPAITATTTKPAAQDPVTKEQKELNKRFWNALLLGNTEEVRTLIAAGANVNSTTREDSSHYDCYSGRSALMYAVSKNLYEIAELLIARGANVNAKCGIGKTPLTLVGNPDAFYGYEYRRNKEIPSSDEKMYTLLLKAGAGKDRTALNDALRYTAYTKSAECCKMLIKAGADVNAKDSYGRTALMNAAYRKSAEAFDGPSAAMKADYRESTECCKMLIEAGADVNAKSAGGYTALMRAHAENCKLLIDAGADVNAKDGSGKTALMYAADSCFQKDPEDARRKCELLIAAGADINAKNNKDITILVHARCAKAIEFFIKAGVDINAKDQYGRTALMRAALNHQADICKVLVDAGADVNAQNNQGKTALMLAIEYKPKAYTTSKKCKALCKILLDGNADIMIKNHNGKNAFEFALNDEQGWFSNFMEDGIFSKKKMPIEEVCEFLIEHLPTRKEKARAKALLRSKVKSVRKDYKEIAQVIFAAELEKTY